MKRRVNGAYPFIKKVKNEKYIAGKQYTVDYTHPGVQKWIEGKSKRAENKHHMTNDDNVFPGFY